MSILAWIIVGGAAGWLASLVMKTDAKQGMLMDVIVGVIGAFIGGAVLSFVGVEGASDAMAFNLPSLLTAFIGAVIFIGALKLIRR